MKVDLDMLLTILMAGMAASVVWGRTLMRSLLALSSFGMLATARYILLRAPDVAMTEAALGVGMGSLVYLLALSKLGGSTA